VGDRQLGLLVQAPASHRNLELDEARELAEAAPDSLERVLVTPTDEVDAIDGILDEVPADVVQTTGAIEPEDLVTLADEHGVDAWKGLGLSDKVADTVEAIDRCADAGADAVVLDALQEGYGGHGEQIDWGHAGQARRSIAIDLVLAGGLTPDNVAEAVREVDPWGVDVSSGIETDEANDEAKMRAFVTAARDHEEEEEGS
jgi:phosphoribosylanthranilate isomerase